jgi:hypothetical protein
LARYGNALGAADEKSWRLQAASVLSHSLETYTGDILAIELTNYQPYSNPINLGSIPIGDSGFSDKRELDKTTTDQLLNLLPKLVVQPPLINEPTKNIPIVGAGFGSPEQNKKVEESAIEIITNHYKSKGWTVQSVENDKIGYDLVCRNGSSEENVEVKGISGGDVSFIITKNELNAAKNNPKFVLCVVLNALSPSPTIHRFSGIEFTSRFELSVIQYIASLVIK